MTSDFLELWAYCDPCHRWFFVPRRPDGQRPSPQEHRISCPVCVMPAGRFEGRDPEGQAAPVQATSADVTLAVAPVPSPA